MEDARLKLLEAVNNILPYLGENPVTNIDARHPTVALILDNIKQQKLNLLGEGWWFNELRITLYPSSEGEIYVPCNTISFYSEVITHTERNRKVYNTSTGSYIHTEPIKCKIVEDLEFEELPYYAALVIQERSAQLAYVKDYGVESAIEVMQKKEQEAWFALNQEHLRNKRYNSLQNRRAFRFMRALRG